MKDSLRTGITFGLTSAVITTLGLMVGLHSGTGSKMVVLGGVLTIAIADAFSDALGIHVSEEAKNIHTTRQIWVATIATFMTKFIFSLTFVVPVLFLALSTAHHYQPRVGLVHSYRSELLHCKSSGRATMEDHWRTRHDSHRCHCHHPLGW